MAYSNDDKIKEVLATIKAKKESMGERPKPNWKTNGIYQDADGMKNINTITSVDTVVDILGMLLAKQSHNKKAWKALGLPDKEVVYNGFPITDWIEDFKQRAKIIAWNVDKQKLDKLEGQLSDLRSEDAKTEDAILTIEADISNLCK